MAKPVGYAFLRRRRRWRAALAQGLLIVVGLLLGLLIPAIDRGPSVPAQQVGDMLIAVGLGLLGSVAVIFSLLFLVVQWAATTFTPRLTLFRDDPIVWRTFAVAIGQAVFSITAALAIGDRDEVSVAVPAASVLLLLAMFALLRMLQLRAFAAIQLAPALGSIAARGRAVLDITYPAGPVGQARSTRPLPQGHATIVWPNPPVVLQYVLADELRGAATRTGTVIVLRAVPGTTLHWGEVVADVHGPPIPPSSVIDFMVVGRERTFARDALLAPRLLADIALRALSPAVNDPATAVQALDELEDLLHRVGIVDSEPVQMFDSTGDLRVVLPLPQMEEFVRSALDEIIAASTASPMTLHRLHGLLTRVRAGVDHRHRPLLDARLVWINELAEQFPHSRAFIQKG